MSVSAVLYHKRHAISMVKGCRKPLVLEYKLICQLSEAFDGVLNKVAIPNSFHRMQETFQAAGCASVLTVGLSQHCPTA